MCTYAHLTCRFDRMHACRHRAVRQHFPSALGVDDWMSRVESILAAYGFAGDNSIGKNHP